VRIISRAFGEVAGRPVTEFVLRNRRGSEARVIDYGATLTALRVAGRDGSFADVVAGFDDLDGYLNCPAFFGAIVGRVANRIADGRFELDGREYRVATNDPPHHLHGGTVGWDKVLWSAASAQTPRGPEVRLTYVSVDGEEGYPGSVSARVRYLLTEEDELCIDMSASCEETTLVNMAHHSYWNLSGEQGRDILEHELTLHADDYTPGNPVVPYGVLQPVAGTPFDFRHAKPVGRDIESVGGDPGGYDHNYVVRGPVSAMRPVARLKDPRSGRVMELTADQPGVQFYSGNFLDGSLTGKGASFGKRSGLCLETQAFPNAINVPAWANQVILPAGGEYEHHMVHRFFTE